MMTYHVQFLLLVLAGWVNRQQQDVIDYQQEENVCSEPGFGQASQALGRRAAQARRQGPGFGRRCCTALAESKMRLL